jgi:hypothetical protein
LKGSSVPQVEAEAIE